MGREGRAEAEEDWEGAVGCEEPERRREDAEGRGPRDSRSTHACSPGVKGREEAEDSPRSGALWAACDKGRERRSLGLNEGGCSLIDSVGRSSGERVRAQDSKLQRLKNLPEAGKGRSVNHPRNPLFERDRILAQTRRGRERPAGCRSHRCRSYLQEGARRTSKPPIGEKHPVRLRLPGSDHAARSPTAG